MSSSHRSRLLFGSTIVAIAFLGAVSTACTGEVDAPRLGRIERVYEPGPVVLPRLTEAQYRASVEQALGGQDVDPSLGPLPQLELEPDTNPYLFYNVGAASTTLSEVGTQRYEESAHAIANAVVLDPARRAAVVGVRAREPRRCVRERRDLSARSAPLPPSADRRRVGALGAHLERARGW